MPQAERRPIIVGNWKMNLHASEASELASSIADQLRDSQHADLAVCPSFVYLTAVGAALADSPVALGAQDVYHEANGAYTGEISTSMLTNVGCRYVILGHSERRHILGETDAQVRQKTVATLAAGLTPIVCVGETLQEREEGRTGKVVQDQFDGSLSGLAEDQFRQVVIAYEPVWAIGTGKVATPDQAEEVHAELRELMSRRYNAAVAETVRIQYGGSVKSSNAAELLAKPNIDGALVGGASLKADEFQGIVNALSR